jgi:hypothetical protein
VLHTITEGVAGPISLAINPVSGDTFVGNFGISSVTVYARDGTSVLRTISQGVSAPRALAFGP